MFAIRISGAADTFENVFGIVHSTTLDVDLQPVSNQSRAEPETLTD